MTTDETTTESLTIDERSELATQCRNRFTGGIHQMQSGKWGWDLFDGTEPVAGGGGYATDDDAQAALDEVIDSHVSAAFADVCTCESAFADVRAEIRRATTKFPTWPTDPLHALAVLGEEFGELTQAILQMAYEPHKSSPAHVRIEAIQTAAMAVRMVISLDKYHYAPSAQHRPPELQR